MKGNIWNRTLKVFSVTLCLAAIGLAQELSQVEREKALRYLLETRSGVQETVKGLTDAQLNFKPSPYRWSIAEIVEHIAVTEGFLVKNVLDQLKNSPAVSQDHDPKQVDEMIVQKVPDRSAKFQAPEPIMPTGRWTAKAALDHFLESRGETVSFLVSTPDLRRHSARHPALGQLDGYQWVLTIAAHTDRHIKQIIEVKNDPHFPAE